MLFNDIFVAVIYLALTLVFVSVAYGILPKDFKKLLKKILKAVYQKMFKNEKTKKKEG